ncbi:HTH_Tnp_Tc3_2 domain-containing protein [Trichonephila clavipes]|nr:HTH_Tnp_Tc3_2 domain-containing protein [Trichonephila clavipes]
MCSSVTEFRFSVSADDQRKRVGRQSWHRSHSVFVVESYVDEILMPVVLPMISSHPGDIYQQDNTSPHTAPLSQQCLHVYATLKWPSRSPDISLIDQVLRCASKTARAVPEYW